MTEIRGNSNQDYNGLNQITKGSGSTAFTYDGNGNPTQYEGTTLAWDALNRMTSCGTTTDTYGVDGLRASLTSSGSTTYFLNDGTMPVVELNSSGGVSALNLFGADGIIGRQNSSGAWSEYVFDLLGNTAIRTDINKNATAGFAYDAYGWYTANGTSPAADPWMYKAQSGYYYDSGTNLNLCGHRFYDPGLARWLNRDPISYAGGANLYGYCGGNPILRSDPSGLQVGEELVFSETLLEVLGEEEAGAGVCECAAEGGLALNAGGGEALAGANDFFAGQQAGRQEVLGSLESEYEAQSEACSTVGREPAPGVNVYRVFGGNAGPFGRSWTPIDPSEVGAFRAEAGLPDLNNGQYLIQGELTDPQVY